MTTPGDESRTELAWREIVEHYGERPVLDDEATTGPRESATTDVTPDVATSLPAEEDRDDEDDEGDRVEDVAEARERAVAESERFRPPPAPPLPRPRTWQRAVAWSGLFVAPVIALVVGLLSIYVTPLLGWALVAWFVGGFAYLVREMPRSPRDPWDDGSRV